MTTTQLINLLKPIEIGASGRSREITIRKITKGGRKIKILDEKQFLKLNSTGDGIAGSQVELIFNSL